MGNGLFNAAIAVEVSTRPFLNYTVNMFKDSNNEQVIEESKKEYKRENQLTFDYYVSVYQDGNKGHI